MKRRMIKAEFESLSYDLKKLYEKTEDHMKHIEQTIKQAVKDIEKISIENIEEYSIKIENHIDSIYKNALDSYSKINVAKDLGVDNEEQLSFGKDKIVKLEKELKELESELKDIQTKSKNYEYTIEILRGKVKDTQELLDKMEKHEEQKDNKKEALNKLLKVITSKRINVIKNVNDGIMETCNNIMHCTHELEKVKEEMKQNLTSSGKDIEDVKNKFKVKFETIFNNIGSFIEEIREDIEIGLDINSKSGQNVENKNEKLKELYDKLKEITDQLHNLKTNNVTLNDEYETLTMELKKLHSLMLT